MRKIVRSLTAVSWLVLTFPFALAAADTHDCAQITHDGQRLACYDAAFGKPVRAVVPPAAKRKTESQPAEESAAVSSVRSTLDGRFIATLANGKVWEQVERDAVARIELGDSVTIRRALLGSYLLVTKEGITTRVRQAR